MVDYILLNLMINLEQCRKILRDNNYQITDDEIKELRVLLYKYAAMQVDAENKEIKDQNDEKSNNILSCE